jgi:hypothetical protein
MAQWLLEIKPDIDLLAEDGMVFRHACKNGYLQIAQWLLQVDPAINVSMENEFPFRAACTNGRWEVAQWLLEINPDIDVSAAEDDAFRSACERGHWEVAQWLQQLVVPAKYELQIENHQIVSYRVVYVLNIQTDMVVTLNRKEHHETLTCPICYEKEVEVETNCGHRFCVACITTHGEKNQTGCPCCRTALVFFRKIEIH